MSEAIITVLITGGITLLGVLVTNSRTRAVLADTKHLHTLTFAPSKQDGTAK